MGLQWRKVFSDAGKVSLGQVLDSVDIALNLTEKERPIVYVIIYGDGQ
jgi:hypothetical protein